MAIDGCSLAIMSMGISAVITMWQYYDKPTHGVILFNSVMMLFDVTFSYYRMHNRIP